MIYRYTIYKPFCEPKEQVEFSELNKLELYLGAIPKDCVCKIDRLIGIKEEPGFDIDPITGTPIRVQKTQWEQVALLKW